MFRVRDVLRETDPVVTDYLDSVAQKIVLPEFVAIHRCPECHRFTIACGCASD
jgi:hypothetical protein